MADATPAPRRTPSVPVYEPARLMLRLVEVRRETADISSFTFAPEDLPGPLRFHPGQALTLEFDLHGETLFRTFTIASSPTRPAQVTLTVKAAAHGRVTNWMHAELRPGALIPARGPVGRFSVVWHHAKKLLLVSAGSGATPMMAMLRWLADRREETDIAYVHVARTQGDLLFRDELAAIGDTLVNLRIHFAVTSAGADWDGPVGRISPGMLARMVPDLLERETFCCGPTPFMDAVESIHRGEGGDPARFHTETFGVTAPEVTASAPLAVDGAPLSITLAGRTLAADAAHTVLAAALAGGVVIPTGCRNGICGTCRLHKASGEVDMHHNGGLSEREIGDGFILACCSIPRSDLVLEFPER